MIAILGFGSLIAQPGAELEAAKQREIEVEPPFAVEFARRSNYRGGAPTLVRVKDGNQVRAVLFVLKADITEETASDILWRRETDKVGSKEPYRRPSKPGPNNVLVEALHDFAGI